MATKIFDYTTAMAELQQLLSDIQGGDVAVDDAINKYERGQELIEQLQAYLETAENKIAIHKVE